MKFKDIDDLLKKANAENWPTQADAQEFIDTFRANAFPGITAELVGSLAGEKEEAKDIDVVLRINEREVPEENYDQMKKPMHWFIMEKIGAEWLANAGGFVGKEWEKESEWWDWKGFVVDLYFEEE